jgi:hypothetical protein
MEIEMASFFESNFLKRLDQVEYLDLDHICIKSDELSSKVTEAK